MLQGPEKWGAFYNCQAYLLPSHQENFGIAIVEAMACKKPVVISKNVNIWKEVQGGNGGLILNELNEAEIYNVLLAISCLSETQIIQKGVEAYETFQTNFNVQDRATVLLKVLNQL
jgi:glycosyltransferase involved in cell wall biosynthesis